MGVSVSQQKSTTTKYRLELTEEQCGVMNTALELYFRLGMGQLSELAWHFAPIEDRDRVEVLLREMKRLMYPKLDHNAYYSISSHEIDDTFRVACDIRDVVRYQLAGDRDPSRKTWSVDHNKPMHMSKEPLPKIERITHERKKNTECGAV